MWIEEVRSRGTTVGLYRHWWGGGSLGGRSVSDKWSERGSPIQSARERQGGRRGGRKLKDPVMEDAAAEAKGIMLLGDKIAEIKVEGKATLGARTTPRRARSARSGATRRPARPGGHRRPRPWVPAGLREAVRRRSASSSAGARPRSANRSSRPGRRCKKGMGCDFKHKGRGLAGDMKHPCCTPLTGSPGELWGGLPAPSPPPHPQAERPGEEGSANLGARRHGVVR